MHTKQRFPNVIFGPSLRPEGAALAIPLQLFIFVLLFMTLTAQPAQAQTFKVIHNVTGGLDGANPYAGLTMDKTGNPYGTAFAGGNTGGNCAPTGCGTVYRLKRSGSKWLFNPLYSFAAGDGYGPQSRVVFGPDGSLYGTTFNGGGYASGTVFNLRPSPTRPATVLSPWTESVLYRFTGLTDGGYPSYGDLTFDQARNIYGTTGLGGGGQGTVYKLTPSGSGWTESVLYAFSGKDGAFPYGGVIFDNAGNLYGTTSGGGAFGWGTVFQLVPSGSEWTENVLYNFTGGNDGSNPIAGLVFDNAGNLYGTTRDGGPNQGCTAFELTPSGGSWTYTSLSGFDALSSPYGKVVMDEAGSLYGTTENGGGLGCFGVGCGTVYKLTNSSGSWTYTSLHDFTDEDRYGSHPYCNLVFDANGNLYGTTYAGGAYGYGVIFEITR